MFRPQFLSQIFDISKCFNFQFIFGLQHFQSLIERKFFEPKCIFVSWCYNKVVNRVTSVNKWCLHTMVLKLVSGTTGECMPLNGDGPVPYWLSWSFSPLSPLDSVSHGSWPWTVWQRNSAQQFLMKNKKLKISI